MIAKNARTPLTIGSVGFSRKRVIVVLPEKEYSTEELHMICRHELVHIQRDDAGSKFLLVFLTALCWFNPLLWIAMRKSAEDIELSCDEAVLSQESEEKRRKYAELLLTTPGDERGFTTCLSVKAKSLRYRLREAVHPKKKLTGAFLAGVLTALLFLMSGTVCLAVGGESFENIVSEKLGGSAEELLAGAFFEQEAEAPGEEGAGTEMLSFDPEELAGAFEKIAGMPLYETKEQSWEKNEPSEVYCFVHSPSLITGAADTRDYFTFTERNPHAKIVRVEVWGRYVEISCFEDGVMHKSCYYMKV